MELHMFSLPFFPTQSHLFLVNTDTFLTLSQHTVKAIGKDRPGVTVARATSESIIHYFGAKNMLM